MLLDLEIYFQEKQSFFISSPYCKNVHITNEPPQLLLSLEVIKKISPQKKILFSRVPTRVKLF